MKRHAYLMMIHDQIDLAKTILELIDDERNDIFIHFDYKFDIDICCLDEVCKRSNVYVAQERINVFWGDLSIVKATYILMNMAFKEGEYSYYHLISGHDMLLKSQDHIHDFMDENDYEYVHFASEEKQNSVMIRYLYKWHFMNKFKDKKSLEGLTKKALCYSSLLAQKILGLKRGKNEKDIVIRFGSAWFSITNDMVKYLLEKEEWVYERYQDTLLPDESFCQTLLYNSPFRKKLYVDCSKQTDDYHEPCLRAIDWKRGGPYVWQAEDFEELVEGNCLFARKVDLHKSSELIQMIVSHLSNDEED